MGTSGVMCKSFYVAGDKASIVIAVSRGTSVELGFGPMVIVMPLTPEA
jgi:hypothetical protein